ncbi:hypothetical protein DNTS_007245 [Danionella cerebrum]|uniref:NADH dehydrogenase [ubiquinone] 1 alpha subcomplex assembly factor 4 n=1 Tax=Danionella cerebrum TaxID=2873325 RepID=A0A553NRC7_9TELE|nr:hypothetical protein DNTS_007245 [Danionella translucida]
MGSVVTRTMRSFNVENRVEREISKHKRRIAPRHPTKVSGTAEGTLEVVEINQKSDPLVSMLKNVYVESKDLRPQVDSRPVKTEPETESQHRLLEFNVPSDIYSYTKVTKVPKGKIALVEVLTALNNHKTKPEIWTPEKLAQEYSLDLKDVNSLTEYFSCFNLLIVPKKVAKMVADS